MPQYDTAQSNLQSLNYGYGREDQEWYGKLSDALNDPIGWFRGKVLGDNKARTSQDMINNLNRQWQLEDWYRAAEWNTPANQRRLMEEAGFNPHMALGSSTGTMAQGSTATGAVPNTSDGKMLRGMGIMESFLRLRQGFASLREQELKNTFLSETMSQRIDEIGGKNRLRAVQTLTQEQRLDAARITNSYLDDIYSDQQRMRKESANHLAWSNSVAHYNMLTGIYQSVAELMSFGMDYSDIHKCLEMSGLQWFQEDDFRSHGLISWHSEERKLDKAERGAAISEAKMSKVLSDMGIHEGDPLYTRMMAVAQGASGDAVTAAAVSDKVLDTAFRIFGAANTAVGNAVRNDYVRRQTARAGFINFGTQSQYGPSSADNRSRYLDLSTGEIVGGF